MPVVAGVPARLGAAETAVCSQAHQSLFQLPPSTWWAAVAVPHTNPSGKARSAAGISCSWLDICAGSLPRGGRGSMRYRQLGASGLRVSVLTMGTMTFGGRGGFASVGSTDLEEARRQVDRCLEAGVNLIDTANVYSDGLSEEICGRGSWKAAVTRCWWRPRRACPWATAPTTPACRATP